MHTDMVTVMDTAGTEGGVKADGPSPGGSPPSSRVTGETRSGDDVEAARDAALPDPTRAEIDSMPGAVLLEFGTDWCGHCRRAQPLIAEALAGNATVRHIKVTDGPGRRLGRTFGVRLWPTLVFLRDGRERTRLVRPPAADEIRRALAAIAT